MMKVGPGRFIHVGAYRNLDKSVAEAPENDVENRMLSVDRIVTNHLLFSA